VLDDIFCRSSNEELEVEYVSLIEYGGRICNTNCTFKWHLVFWVTIGSNTNLHLTLIYLFSVATYLLLLAESLRWLYIDGGRAVCVSSDDEYTAAGRDGDVLGIDFVSSSESLEVLWISMEEAWVVHRFAERAVLSESNGSVFPVWSRHCISRCRYVYVFTNTIH
jgi:hypothetical protein